VEEVGLRLARGGGRRGGGWAALSGLDGNGEWRPVMLSGEPSGGRRLERAERSEGKSGAEKRLRRGEMEAEVSPLGTRVGIRAVGKWWVTAIRGCRGLNCAGGQSEGH
jgi:hypothetical protein